MATKGPLETFTLEAAADLSGKQYHIVRMSAANQCNQASNATDLNIIGVLQNKPQAGEFATVADGGTSKVVAGGSVSVGNPVTTNGSGRAVAVSSGTNQVVIGTALDAATADGDVISVRLTRPYPWPGIAV